MYNKCIYKLGCDNKLKNELIFILYHVGLSNKALSMLNTKYKEEDLNNIIQGDFLEYTINNNVFEDKDIDMLSNTNEYEKKIKEAQEYILKFKKENISILTYFDIEFPGNIREILNPPFILFAKGNIKLLNKDNKITIVGSRKISEKTVFEINKIVTELVHAKMVTVSGLAFGTDILVHKKTYENSGETIAVLPNSIFEIQPKSHTFEASEILKNNGLIISEYYKEKEFHRMMYVNRNRILSGLSESVIITECDIKSGTMHTARFAWKQNRKIFCLDNNSTGVINILLSGNAMKYKNINSLY